MNKKDRKELLELLKKMKVKPVQLILSKISKMNDDLAKSEIFKIDNLIGEELKKICRKEN